MWPEIGQRYTSYLEFELRNLERDHDLELVKQSNIIKDLKDKIYSAESSLTRKRDYENKYEELQKEFKTL